MSIVRRRYYFWLARAYVARWYKTIISSLILGVAIFFGIIFLLDIYLLPILQKKVLKIGYVGIYNLATVPSEVLSDVSYGLTQVNTNGTISPAAAYKWDITDNGRDYTFYLRRGQFFHNGQELTSYNLPISFQDVNKKVVDKYTVSFILHSPYAPFLASVSKPLLLNDLAGLGKYKISKVDINGGFVRSMTFQDLSDVGKRKIISFYPSEVALKDAYALGNVDEARGIADLVVRGSNFKNWGNTIVSQNTDYNQLVAIFYNTEDPELSDKKLREALSYAIPPKFSEGVRAYSPIRANSIYFAQSPNYGISDISISNDLLSDKSDSKKKTYEIDTTDDLMPVAKVVSDSWKKIGIKTKIKTVDSIPHNFQMLIYPIKLPLDPDQYTLWHSKGENNISNFHKNQRIDKLLEDGRSTNDTEKRILIYSDFQKYLIDEAPATFLYYPQTYSVKKK